MTIAPVPLPLLFAAAAIAPESASPSPDEGGEFTELLETLLASDEPAHEAPGENQVEGPPEHTPPPVALPVLPAPPPPVLPVVPDVAAPAAVAPEPVAGPAPSPEPPLPLDNGVAFGARIVAADAEAPADPPAAAPKPATQAEPAPRVERAREPERAAERQAAPERPAEMVLPQHAHAAPAAPEAAPRAESPAVPLSPSRIEPPAPPDPPRAEMRGVSVVVPTETSPDGGPAPRIELHLAERAGEIHVAVRTADPQVRQVLRSELPVLVERLEQSGVRAEVFSPATERAAAATEAQVARAEAPADSAGRDPMSWGFDDGRRQREQEAARPQHTPRPKSQTRSFFHEFFR